MLRNYLDSHRAFTHELRMQLLRLACIAIIFTTLFSAAAEQPEPVVRMLVPGFKVEELPLHISNLNNLRFAPDGRLFALAYDGRIHILRDSDGDGLEDTDQLYWDKPTLSVPVGMAVSPEGIYVSSHGKVSLLRDTDGDGRADREEILATNWPPTDVASGGVDATGVTLDKKGNVFFGLITADYSNPYRVKDGSSHYDPDGKRGTIQELRRGAKESVTVCNGIRVPYALAFNRAGDLFCTDQEGETWCPNGNPLDELNYIIPGRNYGFPPADEKWLPGLKSEPPLVGFAPQHQSTCGLIFNEPKSGQALFGPRWWEGDSFVAGESRGKIWRVRLVKTASGYVARPFLIARLSMLTLDLAISPKGALYVCCHSGQPDWGTGPKGEGKIFKITYVDRKAPQPVLAWAPSFTEVRVAFDRPVDPSAAANLPGGRIEFGEFVTAADRLEKLKPGYNVVNRQQASPRGKLKIVSARMENARTLALVTDPHPQPANYALTLPGIKPRGSSAPGDTIDLDYDLGATMNQKDWIAFAKTLPGGRDIAKAMSRNLLVFEDPPMSHYPYIHPRPPAANPEAQAIGGDFENGRALFFGENLKCSTCHRIRGEGGLIGPDLSNLFAKDAATVLKDIKEPNASINPDYVAYRVTLNDDTTLTGFVRSQDEHSLRISGADGKEQIFPRHEIRDLVPSSISLMPSGLLDAIKPGQIRDLLTFLLNAPPERSAKEIAGALTPAASNSAATEQDPLRLVLVASKQDHGPNQHDYPAWQKTWHKLFASTPRVEIEDAWLWPSTNQWEHAEVMAFYYWNRDWSAQKLAQMDEFLARGGGIVALHAATIGNPMIPELAQRIGLAADSGKTKYRHTPLDLKISTQSISPIVRGLPQTIHFLDEPYWPMIGDTNKIQVIATTAMDGQQWPMMWTFESGKGRVFASILGHYTATLDDPWYRLIVVRGIAWAGRREAGALDFLAAGSR